MSKFNRNTKTLIKHHLHWLLLFGGVGILGITIALLPDDAEAKRSPELSLNTDINTDTLDTLPLTIPVPTPSTSTEDIDIAPLGEWRTVQVKSGDNLALLFSRQGISPQELYKATSAKDSAERLKKIYPGDELKLRIDGKRLTELLYEFDIGKSLHLVRVGEKFQSEILERTLETRITQTSGVIHDSLFLSAQAAGLADGVTMELAGIFGWDVDFALDIRENDSFTVMYEELYLDGEKVKNGKIIAAEFINRNKTFQAVYYENDKIKGDYYSPDGKSMRKAFLRTPVEFSRISSRFNLKRKHPVLNKIRAHKGVDYAASRGTPIRATGDGKVIHRGTKGGYGRTVIIQHGSRYNTLYAHMSKYARGARNGARVKQGQIIGYIGSSGLATGPHLHYEFRVNGVHRNPLTVKLPSAEPLAKQYMASFQTRAKQMLTRLALVKRTNIASIASIAE